jgi:hypothetical protein
MKKRLPTALLALLIVGGALMLRFSRYDYSFQDRNAIMSARTDQHPAGTDELGRDRAVRVAAAILIGLTGATVAAAITTLIAACFGLAAAFSPQPVSAVLMLVSDAFLSLPWLFLLMMARSLLPLTASPLETALATFLVLAALGWPALRTSYLSRRGGTSLSRVDDSRSCLRSQNSATHPLAHRASFAPALSTPVSHLRARIHRGRSQPGRARAWRGRTHAILGRDAAGIG